MDNGSMELKSREAIYKNAEADANRFNLKCLAVLSVITVMAVIFNHLGLFRATPVVMAFGAAAALTTFLTPLAVCAFNRLRGVKTPTVEREWFHVLIVVCAFIGIGIICVAFSMHAVLLMAVPPLIAAQYRWRRSEFIIVLIVTILLVPAGVYGSFFFGLPDRNLLKSIMTDEESLVFANRLALATPKRMSELFIHYVLPRLLTIAAIDVLSFGIIRRNGRMVEEQFALSEKARAEMESRHRMQDHVIEVLANLIETRDAGTGEHIIRTKQYVGMLAEAMRKEPKYSAVLTDEVIERMKSAAPLHDVGKIASPDSILLKPARLTKEEFDIMKTHSSKGGDIIENLFSNMEDAAFLKMAEEIAVSHHERWDGTGYPNGLKGEDIPLPARIMAVADVYDALVSVRVYKGAMTPRDALGIIYEESGTHFDPEVINIVKKIEGDLISTVEEK